METEIRQIMDELNFIKNELHEIKQNMPDKECFLDKEETDLLVKSKLNEKKGKLISSKSLRKSLKI